MAKPTDPLDKGSVRKQPGRKREHCIRCGKHTRECGPLSTRYMCYTCGTGASIQCMVDIHRRKGPYYTKWRDAMVAAVSKL